jgi:hypothetical protein
MTDELDKILKGAIVAYSKYYPGVFIEGQR